MKRPSADLPPPLGRAILGLLSGAAMTGYEIGRLFAETPMMVYSSSPGAIYPAIGRLAAAGLVESVPAGPESTKSAFAITRKGRAVLLDWLRAPVARADVEHGMADLMLRFAFMSGALPEREIRRFLADLRRELDAHVEALAVYAREMRPQMPPTGALALEAGIESYRTHARWAERAREAFAAEGKARGRKSKGRRA